MALKTLPGLRMRKRWTAHLACVGGCLDYLGQSVSDGWLWGGTAHAFLVNIHATLCPSGPTAWRGQRLFDLANNLGYDVRGVFAQREHAGEGFAAKQREAWDFARAAIDRGVPCYGWELWPYVPDYLLINGYDEVGYYYTGYRDGGPTPWNELGTHDVQILEVYSVEPCAPAAPDKVVRDALNEAVRLAGSPEDTIFPPYRARPAGLERWAEALERGEALYDGNAYNAQVWSECRELAVEFLREARLKLAPAPASTLSDALAQTEADYAIVCDRIKALLRTYPERGPQADWKSTLQSADGASLMREAAEAERRGVEGLKRILAAL